MVVGGGRILFHPSLQSADATLSSNSLFRISISHFQHFCRRHHYHRHLVFVVPTSGLEGMSATDQHPGFLGLGDHSDVVLALRLMVRLLLPRLS